MVNPDTPRIEGGPASGRSPPPLPSSGTMEGRIVRPIESSDLDDETLEALRFLFESAEPEEPQDLSNRQTSVSIGALPVALEVLHGEPPEALEATRDSIPEPDTRPSAPPLPRLPPLTDRPPGPGTYTSRLHGLKKSCVMADDGTWVVKREDSDGTTYEGEGRAVFRGQELLAVVPNGRGRETRSNGMLLEGEWKQGRSVGFFKVSYTTSGSLSQPYDGVKLNPKGNPEGFAFTAMGQPVLFRDGQLLSPSPLLGVGGFALYTGSKNSLGNLSGLGILSFMETTPEGLLVPKYVYGNWKDGRLSSGALLMGKNRYEGSLENNLPQGSGEAWITASDGSVHHIAGWWKNGELQYQRQRFDVLGGNFDGPCDAEGLPHGKGVLKKDDGSIVFGDWEHGQLPLGEVKYSSGLSYKGPLNPLTLQPDTSTYPDQLGEQLQPGGSIVKGPFLNGAIQMPYTVLTGAHAYLYESKFPDGRFLGRVSVPCTEMAGEFNKNGQFLKGQISVEGVTGNAEIRVDDPFALGSCTGIENLRASAAGAVLNRWESPLLRDDRIAGHYLLDDLTSFCLPSEGNQGAKVSNSSEVVDSFRTTVGPQLQTILQNAIVYSAGNHDRLPIDRIQPQQQTEPVILLSGWQGHAVDYVFYQNQLFICQRAGANQWRSGFAGSRINPIDRIPFQPEKLPELLECLERVRNLPEKEAQAILYGDDADSLRGRFTDPTRASAEGQSPYHPEWSAPVRMQRVGNCVLFSAMTALLCAGQLLMQEKLPPDMPPQAATREVYKAFRDHQKQKARAAFASLTRKELPGMPGMRLLVEEPSSGEISATQGERRIGLIENPQGEIVGQGDFQNGELKSGTLKTQGMEYRGYFQNGLLHGLGSRIDLRTFTSFLGNFDHGRLSGAALIVDPRKESHVEANFDQDTQIQ